MFSLINLVLWLTCIIYYLYLRSGISSYCNLLKMSRSFIKKNSKGFSNRLFYTEIHKQKDIGYLYQLNRIYLLALALFFVAVAFSWVSFF